MQPLGNLTELIFSVTRLVVGFTFSLRGAQKLFGVLDGDAADLFSRLGVAGVIEFFGGALISLGLYTPWVAFLASGEMAFAYFITHHPRGAWPLTNDGEPAVLYCFIFLYFASRGSGPLSLDRIIRGQRS